MEALLSKLRTSFPLLNFVPGNAFVWSPKKAEVIYRADVTTDTVAAWSLLHEVGHALLDHKDYQTDFQLLKMEVAAWQKARRLAKKFGYRIDENHIEDCLDTYREWLYQRSTCPSCTSAGVQADARTYHCLNCATAWQVSASRMCRPYRRKSFVK